MRLIESMEDRMNGVVTYELSNGQRFRCSQMAVEEVGAANLLRQAGLGHLLPTERVPVMWAGRKAGTLPPDFDPHFIKSKNWLYDPRPGDFTRDGDKWVASPKMGPGDLEAVPGFQWEREPAPSTSTPTV
jgi:hypothetical protein